MYCTEQFESIYNVVPFVFTYSVERDGALKNVAFGAFNVIVLHFGTHTAYTVCAELRVNDHAPLVADDDVDHPTHVYPVFVNPVDGRVHADPGVHETELLTAPVPPFLFNVMVIEFCFGHVV